MGKLRRQGDMQRAGFELQIAGTCNTKAARALLSNYDNDIEKLKTDEPWLFGAGEQAPAPSGATGLPSAGATSNKSASVGERSLDSATRARNRKWQIPSHARETSNTGY